MEQQNITTSALMKKANISANIISRLRRNEYVSLETVENICAIFYCQANDILNFSFSRQEKNIEKFSSNAEIQNRRYLGNKFKLLDFIKEVAEENCSEVETVADIFRCFNEDANELVKHIKADLIYIDPPYNSRQLFRHLSSFGKCCTLAKAVCLWSCS